MRSILGVTNLTKTFGGLHAVDDISFDLPDASVTALIGPNGAGKSTCFNLLSGNLQPDRGQISFIGKNITRKPQHERANLGIGRTFQIAATFASMTVRENIWTAITSSGGDQNDIDELLHATGMQEHAETRIPALSYGDIKAVELAMALAARPALLLLDEPTAGMSASSRTAILDRVIAIAKTRQMTVLFTEHDMGAVFGYASRILVMDQGKLIADGAPDDIRQNAVVQKVYLGEGESSHA